MENMIQIMISRPHYVWVAMSGYDTRPYAWNPKKREILSRAPVAHEVGFANRHQQAYDVPAGDIAGWLATLPEGTLIISPDYSGSEWRGEWVHDARSGEFIGYDEGDQA